MTRKHHGITVRREGALPGSADRRRRQHQLPSRPAGWRPPKNFDETLESVREMLSMATIPMLTLAFIQLNGEWGVVIVVLIIAIVATLHVIEHQRFDRSLRAFDGSYPEDREWLWDLYTNRRRGRSLDP